MSPKETKEKYGSWYSYRRHGKLVWRSLGKVEPFCSFYFYLYRSLSNIIYRVFYILYIYRGQAQKIWGLGKILRAVENYFSS